MPRNPIILNNASLTYTCYYMIRYKMNNTGVIYCNWRFGNTYDDLAYYYKNWMNPNNLIWQEATELLSDIIELDIAYIIEDIIPNYTCRPNIHTKQYYDQFELEYTD